MTYFAAAASAALCLPGLALAQAAPGAPAGSAAPATGVAPTFTAGATIYDPQGLEVGTIDSTTVDSVLVAIGANKVALPKTAFGAGAKGLTVTVSKAQIDAQIAAAADKTAAALDASLTPGAQVRDKAGVVIGTVKESSADQVVIDRPSGAVSLPKTVVAAGPQGPMIALTAAELDSAAKAAAPGAAAKTPGT